MVLAVLKLAGWKALVVGGGGEQQYRQDCCVQSLQVPCLGRRFRGPGASLVLELA